MVLSPQHHRKLTNRLEMRVKVVAHDPTGRGTFYVLAFVGPKLSRVMKIPAASNVHPSTAQIRNPGKKAPETSRRNPTKSGETNMRSSQVSPLGG